MKKLFFTIALCPTTQTLAMLATRGAALTKTAATLLTQRSIQTTPIFVEHQHTATFPISSTLLQSYMTMRQQKEHATRERLKEEARKDAEARIANLEEQYKHLKAVLDTKQATLPWRQYCDMTTKIGESLMGGKQYIIQELGAELERIDKERVTLSTEDQEELNELLTA